MLNTSNRLQNNSRNWSRSPSTPDAKLAADSDADAPPSGAWRQIFPSDERIQTRSRESPYPNLASQFDTETHPTHAWKRMLPSSERIPTRPPESPSANLAFDLDTKADTARRLFQDDSEVDRLTNTFDHTTSASSSRETCEATPADSTMLNSGNRLQNSPRTSSRSPSTPGAKLAADPDTETPPTSAWRQIFPSGERNQTRFPESPCANRAALADSSNQDHRPFPKPPHALTVRMFDLSPTVPITDVDTETDPIEDATQNAPKDLDNDFHAAIANTKEMDHNVGSTTSEMRQNLRNMVLSKENDTWRKPRDRDEWTEIKKVLYNFWGTHEFRPLQEQVIHSILQDNDLIAVLPTGEGKSACYQIPALIRPGTAMVVSPLLALMEDQVDGLRRRGIPAARLGHDVSQQVQNETLRQLRVGDIKLLYVSPERLVKSLENNTDELANVLAELFTRKRISYLVVDEAHCLLQWESFRKNYPKLRIFREKFPGVPQLCFTATASWETCHGIAKTLGMLPIIFRTPPDRENLHLARRRWETHERTIKEMSQMITVMQERNIDESSAIIYTKKRDDTKKVIASLAQRKIIAVGYQSQMKPREKQENLRRWRSGEIRVMVGTSAFGMGIDKNNVRLILHYGMPTSMEHYVQEIGRGGRDGKRCHCVAFVRTSDADALITHAQNKTEHLLACRLREYFVHEDTCRRVGLREHFGDSAPAGSCNACDVCCDHTDNLDDWYENRAEDHIKTAQSILNLIKLSRRRSLSQSKITAQIRQKIRLPQNTIVQVTEAMLERGFLQRMQTRHPRKFNEDPLRSSPIC